MSSPTFTTLPREIRDYIYELIWESGQIVSPSGWRSDHLPFLSPKLHPFDSCSADATLALLHVNHQISAEAAPVFYGKRTFSSHPRDLASFLTGISLRRHLIKHIELSDFKDIPRGWFDLLRSLGGLRSLTISVKYGPFEIARGYLVRLGIYELTNCVDVIVRSEHLEDLRFPEDDTDKKNSELTNAWTRVQGQRRWSYRLAPLKGVSR